MSRSFTKTGGAAFPIECYLSSGIMQSEGMSLRAHFAGKAVQGLAAYSGSIGPAFGPHEMAKRAYEIADAMLEIELETQCQNALAKAEAENDDRPF